ncbi:nitrilase-related carbon-nitrogen hydrolase [Capnocytophaga leadbetteri]|jgi:nitrilase/cyanide hydratase and apolipoprotein N-acyltransferase|uniref:nitrilase-related carbon-nitrogen hydrolase n=1 Tax=Capnocytophaga leadbetteri TaxID=327575 RepID=UPI0028E3DE8A|nr:nitrilase-related carbon-nitrogen hydrolase [Capnocytophaga leadbetteri]
MKVALVSLNQSWENKAENKQKVGETLALIAEHCTNTDLVVYPEMTLTGFTMESQKVKEDELSSETITFFKEQAKKYKVSIAFGVVLSKGEKATNNLVVVSEQGVLATYAKIHPFSYAGENDYYQAGDELKKLTIGGATIGLTICYDLRFPELYQAYSKDCSVILNIANWPERRVSHWRALNKARAIENQVFMIAVNRIGTDGKGLQYVFSSHIVSPYGEELKGTSLSEEVVVYDLNLEEVAQYRAEFPVKNDRKITLYKEIL